MKKITALFIFLFVFSFSQVIVNAQTSYEVYVSNISVGDAKFSVGEAIDGQFDLYNLAEVPQSEIYYVIETGELDAETMTVYDMQGASSKNGPLYIKEDSQITIPFQYELPQTKTGNVALQITAYLKDGTLVAEDYVAIEVEGEAVVSDLMIKDTYFKLSDLEENIGSQIGPVVYEGDTLQFNYAISSSQEIILHPILRLYDRVDSEESLLETISLDQISLVAGDNLNSFNLSIDREPLVYYGVLSFENEEGMELFSTDLRFIIAGPIATIRNINTDTLSIKSGDKVPFTFTYGGQPIDEIRPEKQMNQEGLMVEIQVFNQDQVLIGTIKEELDLTKSVMNFEVNALDDADNLSFEAKILSNDGKVLDTYSSTLPSQEEVSNQTKIGSQNSIPKVIIYSLIGLILILLFAAYTFLRKKKEFKLPLVAILLGLFGALMVVAVAKVDAWSTVFMYNDNEYFKLNSVSSPKPPEVKMYEPGESFALKFNATYGDCNNESRLYVAYSYPSDSKWWNKLPLKNAAFGEGSNYEDRLAYWANNGVELFNSSEISTWKDRFLELNITEIIGYADKTMSEKKEIALKDLVKRLNIVEVKNSCFRSGCFVSGIKIELYADGKTDMEILTWAKDHHKKITDTQKIIKDFKQDTSDPLPNGLANFNFSDVSNLKSRQVCEMVNQHRAPPKEVCTRYPDGEQTKEYISKLKSLKSELGKFSNGSMTIFYDNFTKGEHSTEVTPVTVNKIYKAPDEPGFHDVYIYLYQKGNNGRQEIFAKQEICVKGKGVCPNENDAMTVSCSSAINPIQANTRSTFTSTVSGNVGPVTYDWKLNGNQVSTTSTYAPTYTRAGTYAPTLTVTDSTNKKKTVTCSNLVVRAPLTVSCTVNASNNTVTTNYGGNIGTASQMRYSWKINDVSSTQTSSSLSINESQYKFEVTLRDSRTNATAVSTCSRGGIEIISCAASPSEVAPGEEATFTGSVRNAIGAVAYTWTDDEGNTSSGSTLTKSWSTAGSYSVTLRAQDTSNSDQKICSVTVRDDVSCSEMRPSNETCADGTVTATYVCNGSTWQRQTTGNSCSDGGGDTSDNASVGVFEFSPNIVGVGQSCKLNLEADNVTSCSLYKGGTVSGVSVPIPVGGKISTFGSVDISIGTYTLKCTGTNGVEYTHPLTRSCILNPIIREN